jgi:hypothetical protein
MKKIKLLFLFLFLTTIYNCIIIKNDFVNEEVEHHLVYDIHSNKNNELTIRYTEYDTIIIFYSKHRKFDCSGTIKIKFDNGDWEEYNYIEPTCSYTNVIYINDSYRFLKNLEYKKHIYINF